MSDSLQLHGLWHARLPWPSLSPGVCSNSCPVSWWCHPIISSSVVPFSSRLQSFPASESFPMSRFFASRGQIIGVWASTSALPMNIQDWFPLGLTNCISLQSKELSRVLSVMPNAAPDIHYWQSLLQHHSSKASILWHSAFFIVQLSHPYMTTGKTVGLTRWTFIWPGGKSHNIVGNPFIRYKSL